MRLLDLFADFRDALRAQLEADDLRWGNTWLNRKRVNQEQRIRIEDYFNEFTESGVPMPWLKIAGLAFIGWVREQPGWQEPPDVPPEEDAP